MKDVTIIEREVYLSDMRPGQIAYICSVEECEMRHRLYDLGFVSTTRVECIAAAALGGPCAYLIRGALIALRRADSGHIRVAYTEPSGGEW